MAIMLVATQTQMVHRDGMMEVLLLHPPALAPLRLTSVAIPIVPTSKSMTLSSQWILFLEPIACLPYFHDTHNTRANRRPLPDATVLQVVPKPLIFTRQTRMPAVPDD